MVLDYLQVFLTWPVIGGTLVATCLYLFRPELKALIGRIGKIKFPGGELTTSQQANIDLAPTSNTPSQTASDSSTVEVERAVARIWEYRYLNYFLAQDTQVVLDWLVTLGQSTTINAYEAVWMLAIQSTVERNAILNALQMHQLIALVDHAITVTDKGREYYSWTERRRPASATTNL